MKMATTAQGCTMNVTMKMSGKYLGAGWRYRDVVAGAISV
jgi:hypothetical protein